MAMPGHLLHVGKRLESSLLLSWVCSRLGPGSWAELGPGNCSAPLSMQVGEWWQG